MKRLRRAFVCLLCGSLLSTTLATGFQARTGTNYKGTNPSVRQESGNSFFALHDETRLGSRFSRSTLQDSWRQREQIRLPPFMVWTSLRQKDFESCLPKGVSVRPVGRQGYVVSDVTDYLGFAVRLSIQSGRLRNEVPRFSRVGEPDPGPPDASQKEILKKLAEIIVNLIYRPLWPGVDETYRDAALLDPNEIKRLLPNGWNPNGPVPRPFGPGFWIILCDPKPPCVRPEEPTPETVPDCKEEQDEVDRLLERIKALEAEIQEGNDLLSILLQIKAGKEALDAALAAMTLMAGLTAPIALTAGTATTAILGGTVGLAAGLAIVLPALMIYAATQLLDITLLNPLINWLKRQIAKLEKMLASYNRGLQDALNELAACKKKAAEAKQRNTDAFQNYINVLLPLYYECLKRRKCWRVWVPK